MDGTLDDETMTDNVRINGTVNNSLCQYISTVLSFFLSLVRYLSFYIGHSLGSSQFERALLLCATDTGFLVCRNSRTKNIRAIPVRSQWRNRGFVASLWHLCGIFSFGLRNVSPSYERHLSSVNRIIFLWLTALVRAEGFPFPSLLSLRVPQPFELIKFHLKVGLKKDHVKIPIIDRIKNTNTRCVRCVKIQDRVF